MITFATSAPKRRGIRGYGKLCARRIAEMIIFKKHSLLNSNPLSLQALINTITTMKCYHILYLLISLVFVSCSENKDAKELFAKAESVMEEHPDSALAMLDSAYAKKDDWKTSQQMRYELLRAKAQNKAYVDFTTDSIMLKVAEYYDSHGTSNEQMEAHYLLGCTYRDMGEAPMALQCYNDAVTLADTTKRVCDFQMLSRVYGQMAVLYYRQASPLQEIEVLELATRYAYASGDTLAALNFCGHLPEAYYILGIEDSVLAISERTCNAFLKHNALEDAAAVLSQGIEIDIDRGNISKAKHKIDLYIYQSGYVDKDGNIEQGHEIFYNTIAEYYAKIDKLDSAEFFYNKMLNSQSSGCKEAAYKGLMSIYERLGQSENAVKYASMYCAANDSSVVAHSSEEINRMQAIYNYSNAQAKKEEAEKKVYKYHQLLFFIFVVVAGTVLISIIWFRKRNKKAKKRLIAENIKYADLLNRFTQSVSELECVRNDADNYKHQKEAEISKLQKSISFYHNYTIQMANWNIEREMYSCNIVMHAHNLAARGGALTQQEIEAIEEIIADNIPHFHSYIASESTSLSKNERLVCLLIRLRFIPTEIASLLNLSIQSVTNIKAKANKKLFKKDGAKTLDIHLMAIKEPKVY